MCTMNEAYDDDDYEFNMKFNNKAWDFRLKWEREGNFLLSMTSTREWAEEKREEKNWINLTSWFRDMAYRERKRPNEI